MPLNLKNMLATLSLLGTQYLHGEWKWEWKWLPFERLKQCPASLSLSASSLASTVDAMKNKSVEEMGQITKSLSAFSSELLACVNINKSSERVQDWFATLFALVGKERLIDELKQCDSPLTDVSDRLLALAECITKFQPDYICEKSLLNFEQAQRALSNCLGESPLMKKASEEAFEKLGLFEMNELLKLSAWGVTAGAVLCSYLYRREIMQFATQPFRRREADLFYGPAPLIRDLEMGLPYGPLPHSRQPEANLPQEPGPRSHRKVKAE